MFIPILSFNCQLLMRTELLSNGVSDELISSYKEQMQTTYGLSNSVAEMATNLVLLGNVGIKTLKDNWENYVNIFNTLEPHTQAYVEAMGEAKNALSQILGGTEVSDEFILNNKDVIYNAFVGGSQEALDKIRKLAAEEIILNVKNKLEKLIVIGTENDTTEDTILLINTSNDTEV